jgi:hypothetical protein
MSVVTVKKITLQNNSLAVRIDELGAELAATKEFETLFDEYIQLQKKIDSADNSKRTEQLLFRLDGVIDQEWALVEKFFYMAGFNDALQKT